MVTTLASGQPKIGKTTSLAQAQIHNTVQLQLWRYFLHVKSPKNMTEILGPQASPTCSQFSLKILKVTGNSRFFGRFLGVSVSEKNPGIIITLSIHLFLHITIISKISNYRLIQSPNLKVCFAVLAQKFRVSNTQSLVKESTSLFWAGN